MKSTYQIWRHHKLIFTGTFEECKVFLIKHNGDAYENCTRAMATSLDEGIEIYTSLQGQLWMTEYASIKPTKETQLEMDTLEIKSRMEQNDHVLTQGE